MSSSALTGRWWLQDWCSGSGFVSALVDCPCWTPWTDQYAMWLSEKEIKVFNLSRRHWTKHTTVSMILTCQFGGYVTFEGLNCSGILASKLFRVSSLPTEFLCSVLSSLLLLLMVESAHEPAHSKDWFMKTPCLPATHKDFNTNWPNHLLNWQKQSPISRRR